MPPAFRILLKFMMHWNFAKDGIDENLRVLKSHKPLFKKLNGCVFIWFLLMLSVV